MPQVHSRTVMLEATRAVELRAGLILPPGFYIGTETYTRLEPVGTGLDRTPSRFEIDLKANQSPVSVPKSHQISSQRKSM
jgi:hypothetical protein